jgi:hypothetical protein
MELQRFRIVRVPEKHPAGGKFCTVCGQPIAIELVPKYRKMQQPHFILNDTDPEEIEHATLGFATLEDIQKLKGSHVIFPEFAVPKGQVVIMAPVTSRMTTSVVKMASSN